MKFVEQKARIKTVKVGEPEVGEGRHGRHLPNTIKAVICGPSNCGKTQSMRLSLLLSKNGLRFENVYVFSKSLNQPKYVFLDKWFGEILGRRNR